MSRLIVKNLPKSITEEKLRSIFSEKGTVTDIRLKYTKDGVFRRFAFIGYHSENETELALQYFNNSCIQTNRIKVEKCASLGAENKPKSWSKYSVDSSAYKKKHGLNILEEKELEKKKEEMKNKKKNAIIEIFGKHKNNPEFKEFLEAHEKNRMLWGNDTSVIETQNEANENAIKSFKIKEKHITKGEAGDMENNSIEDYDKQNEDQIEENENGERIQKIADKEISDLDYMKCLMNKEKSGKNINETEKSSKNVTKQTDLFTIKIRGIPYKTKRQEIINFFKPIKPFSVRVPTKTHGFCYAGFKTEKEFKKAMLKHKSFLKGKQIFLIDFTEKDKISNNDEDSNKTKPKWAKQEELLKNEEDICESGRIFFRNLAYTITEDDLQELFEKYGPVAEINLPVDPLTKQIKGFGIVTFVMPEHAVKAFTELDGSIFHGRLLHLIPGKSKEGKNDDIENLDGLSFKSKKTLKLKQSAQQTYNWNTLFLGSNALAEVLAKQFGEAKETILDTKDGGSNAAVRLALGETQIVTEMKKFLEENDVQLNAFDTAPKKRSKNVILAKNLAAGTTVAELRPIFSKFGLIGRIVLPPSGVTALIEFINSSEANQAFKKLAYTKFKNLPLYLEWAPENTFKKTLNPVINLEEYKEEASCANKKDTKAIKKQNDQIENDVDKKQEIINIKTVNKGDEGNEDDESPEERTTIFLRNLNFKTREDAIREHFKHLGAIHMVQVAMKKDPENPKNRISLGYGFIQFKKRESANRALKEMMFTQIEGNQVELKPSDRILKMDVKAIKKASMLKKQTGTKILVRNIPFQAKLNEIKEIFQVFGHIKSIRLPKKATPGEEQHRGFGFIDYFDKSSARKAFEALFLSTHLYGRKLVLEWAENEDNSVHELRKRTAKDFIGSETQAKKSKKAVFDCTEINTAKDNDDDSDDME